MEIQTPFELIYDWCKVDPSPKRRCGCYIRRPAVLDIKNENVMVPLKHIDYDIEIVNSLVHITLVQTYENPSEKFLELEYSFPLDPKSCIYRFVAQFGKNVIQGIVKQKQEAKKQYKKAIKQGRQAAYGQISDKSSDIINMEIGNVPPNTQVKITISILQELELSMNTFYRLHVPSNISPRYMNDYKLIHDKVKVEEKKSLKSGKSSFTWNFKINVKTNKKLSFFNSPSHKIVLQNQTDTESLLTMSKQCIPCKDFIFYYTTQDFHLPSYVLGRTDVSSTVMLSFIPKFCTLSINDAYKAEMAHKTFDADIDASKGQFIFLLDRSGSMGGKRILNATQALIMFLKSLPSDSYFNIVSFGNAHNFMFNKSQRYNDLLLEKAIKDIQKMKADLGGTQIEKPLKMILDSKVIDGYPKQVFLLTDGAVQNTNKVIQLVERNIKYARVHSIGIGSGASPALIKGCAQKGKGKHIFIDDSENPSEKIIEILGQALSPVISKVDLKYDKSLVKSIVPNPASIPYILKDELVNFYITFNGQIQKEANFTFEYVDSQNKMPYKTQITVNPQSQSQPFVDKMAHYKVIKNLQKASKNQIVLEDYMLYVKNFDYKKSAIDESIKNQVLSEYTAFICVGKQLVDGQYQQYESKGVEKIQIQQPISSQSSQQQKSRQTQKCLRRKTSQSKKKQQPPRSKKFARLPQTSNINQGIGLKKQAMPMANLSTSQIQQSFEFFSGKIRDVDDILRDSAFTNQQYLNDSYFNQYQAAIQIKQQNEGASNKQKVFMQQCKEEYIDFANCQPINNTQAIRKSINSPKYAQFDLQLLEQSKKESGKEFFQQLKIPSSQMETQTKKVENDKLEAIISAKKEQIRQKKKFVEDNLSEALPALQESNKKVREIKRSDLNIIKSFASPPPKIILVMKVLHMMIKREVRTQITWQQIKQLITSLSFMDELSNFRAGDVPQRVMHHISQNYLKSPEWNIESIRKASICAGAFAEWIDSQLCYADILRRLQPIKNQVEFLSQELENLLKQLNSSREGTVENKKSQEYKKLLKSSCSVKDVISVQRSNGSWQDQTLMNKMFPILDETIEQLIKQFSKPIVMTYLIATWIQLNHPDKQYALLVKKAFSWCKKASEEKGIDSEKLKVLDKVV